MTGPNKLSRDGRLRSFWQVLAVYLGASWVVLQVVDVVKQNMGLPDWVFPFALVLLVIGLPVMLTTALLHGRPSKAEAASTPAHDKPRPDLGARRLFTWRNAFLGGGAALVLLAAVTTGFMFMRNRGIGPVGSLVAKGVLDERGKVILADFQAADPEIARAATEAFRVDLAQSTIVTLAEPDSIDDALQRMGRPTDEPLDEDTARELGLRDGIPAVIAGELASVGGGFALSARLVATEDGEVLASARASARDSSAVLDAIDIVSAKLREQIGESYTSLRASPPLAHVTTSSLEALRKYTQAQDARHREGNPEAAIALLEEAVTIDTAFALAHRDLAVIHANMRGNWDRQVQALESAYRHRDRLTPRERYLVEASYSQDVLDDRTATIQAYEAMLRLDPDDAQALNNIGFNYWQQGDFERAGEYYRQARATDPSEAIYAANVGAAWANVGDLARADSAYAALDEMPRGPLYEGWRALLEYERGNEAAARTKFEALAEDYASQPRVNAWMLRSIARLELVHGRLAVADSMLAEAAELEERRGREDAWLSLGLNRAVARLWIAADTAGALQELEIAIQDGDPERIPVLDRPWIWAATIAAQIGDADLAREFVARRDTEVSERYLEIERRYEHDLQAWIALAEGDEQRAITELRRQPVDGCRRCRPAAFARVFDATGMADSAIARFEQYLSTEGNFNLWLDAFGRATTHERLGRLYEERGDVESAALHYAQFVELWADADPELQPRVEAARARMEEIVRERG